VRVEAVVGRIAPDGQLEDVQVLVLEPREQNGSAYSFGRDVQPFATGRLGFAARISTNHFEDPLNRPSDALMKWAEPAG
jgi:starch phosphorylase